MEEPRPQPKKRRWPLPLFMVLVTVAVVVAGAVLLAPPPPPAEDAVDAEEEYMIAMADLILDSARDMADYSAAMGRLGNPYGDEATLNALKVAVDGMEHNRARLIGMTVPCSAYQDLHNTVRRAMGHFIAGMDLGILGAENLDADALTRVVLKFELGNHFVAKATAAMVLLAESAPNC